MFRISWCRGTLFCLLTGVACSSQTPPPESAATGSEPAEPPDHRDEAAANPDLPEPEDSAAEGSGGQAAVEATEPETPAAPPLSTLCETMCGAQSSKCTPKQVRSCEQNYCYRYGNAPTACEPAVRSALSCAQADPNFLLCTNVVPESCAKKFQAAEECLKTGIAPVAEERENAVPAGWIQYEAADANFTVLMPEGITVKTEDGARVWSSEAEGVKYEIRQEPLPAEKRFDQRAFYRIATKLLGRCVPKMKLYSLVEREDRSIIQFSTKCPDQTELRGMLYVHGKDYFIVRASWGEGANPQGDTFVYSFERP